MTVEPELGVGVAAHPQRPRKVWFRILRNPVAVACITVIVVFVLVGLLAPVLAPYDPYAQDFDQLFGRPSPSHWLGTDDLGRDVLSRLMYGARVSLLVGVATTALAFVIAIPIGLISGYYGGWIDLVIARSVDVSLAFPYLIVAIGLVVILGPSIWTVTIALAVGQIPWMIRIVRGEVLSLREHDYVSGAVLDGAGDLTILSRHILPNLVSPLIVQATLLIPFGIIGEALLSFLGLGVLPPTATWGVMLASAQSFAQQDPLLAVVPGVTIAVVTFSFNLLGDALRDVLDPRAY